jgi:hypothetical protein
MLLLSLLRAALATDKDAAMFILLSGQDYPLLNPKLIADYFEKNRNANFMNWGSCPGPTGRTRVGLNG